MWFRRAQEKEKKNCSSGDTIRLIKKKTKKRLVLSLFHAKVNSKLNITFIANLLELFVFLHIG